MAFGIGDKYHVFGDKMEQRNPTSAVRKVDLTQYIDSLKKQGFSISPYKDKNGKDVKDCYIVSNKKGEAGIYKIRHYYSNKNFTEIIYSQILTRQAHKDVLGISKPKSSSKDPLPLVNPSAS